LAAGARATVPLTMLQAIGDGPGSPVSLYF